MAQELEDYWAERLGKETPEQKVRNKARHKAFMKEHGLDKLQEFDLLLWELKQRGMFVFEKEHPLTPVSPPLPGPLPCAPVAPSAPPPPPQSAGALEPPPLGK